MFFLSFRIILRFTPHYYTILQRKKGYIKLLNNYSIILPSVEMVTTLHGINFPLAIKRSVYITVR